MFIDVIALGLAALVLVSTALAFYKANKPFWAVIIPLYNQWVVYEIAETNPWLSLIYSVPLVAYYVLSFTLKRGAKLNSGEIAIIGFFGIMFMVGLVFYAKACIRIAERFKHSKMFGLFFLFLLSPIGWPIIAFSNDEYKPTIKAKKSTNKARSKKTSS